MKGWVGLGWLVTYWNKVPPPGVEPGHFTHPITNRARRRVTSLIRPTPLPLRHAANRLYAPAPVCGLPFRVSVLFRKGCLNCDLSAFFSFIILVTHSQSPSKNQKYQFHLIDCVITHPLGVVLCAFLHRRCGCSWCILFPFSDFLPVCWQEFDSKFILYRWKEGFFVGIYKKKGLGLLWA